MLQDQQISSSWFDVMQLEHLLVTLTTSCVSITLQIAQTEIVNAPNDLSQDEKLRFSRIKMIHGNAVISQ